MPVSKHRNIADVGLPPVSESATESLRAAFELMALCRRLHPWQTERGVHKRRTTGAAWHK